MRPIDILTKIEEYYTKKKPTAEELKLFIKTNILNVDECKNNEIKRLEQNFSDISLPEKYNLLLNKYLDLCIEREITCLMSYLTMKQSVELSKQTNDMRKEIAIIKSKLTILKEK